MTTSHVTLYIVLFIFSILFFIIRLSTYNSFNFMNINLDLLTKLILLLLFSLLFYILKSKKSYIYLINTLLIKQMA